METASKSYLSGFPGFFVPPSGGSLEIGNCPPEWHTQACLVNGSPFGGIPRNWKLEDWCLDYSDKYPLVPPSGGSLEIGNDKGVRRPSSGVFISSPFGGIPRNWKLQRRSLFVGGIIPRSPFGGIPRNWKQLYFFNWCSRYR